MPDIQTVAAILSIGAVSIAMRLSGYLAADAVPKDGSVARIIRLAPGNLSIAFVAVGCFAGGWTSFIGSIAALTGMVLLKRQWAALGVGFIAAALVAALR